MRIPALILLVILVSFTDTLHAFSSDSVPPLMGPIHRRYYLIKRLEKPINALYNMQQHHRLTTHDAPARARDSFDALWIDFLSYKYINDDLFEREMIIATLLFYKDMLATSFDFKENAHELCARIDTYINSLGSRAEPVAEYALETLLHDMPTGSIKTDSPDTHLLQEILLGHSAWSDFYPEASSTMQATVGTLVHVLGTSNQEPTRLVVCNTMRLYHIQRMLKSLFILSHFAKMPIHFSSPLSEKVRTPILRDCVIRMEKSHSLLPLFQVWQRIICYDFIDDGDEIKEFMHLLIIVYKSLTCSLHQSRMQKNSESIPDAQLLNILEVYDHVSQLEIAELLDLLDDIALHLDHIAHMYELHNPHLRWIDWFKKYWWIFPVVVTWFYFSLLKHKDIQVHAI